MYSETHLHDRSMNASHYGKKKNRKKKINNASFFHVCREKSLVDWTTYYVHTYVYICRFMYDVFRAKKFLRKHPLQFFWLTRKKIRHLRRFQLKREV